MRNREPIDVLGLAIIVSVAWLIVTLMALEDDASARSTVAYQRALTTVLDCRQKQAQRPGVQLDTVCGPIPRRGDF
jgi:hypothetical protein